MPPCSSKGADEHPGNARGRLPGGKGPLSVSLKTSRHFTESVRLSRQVENTPSASRGRRKQFLRIHIRDGRPRHPPEIQDRIVAPFSPTKKNGTGNRAVDGQKIVHAHGGVLGHDSRKSAKEPSSSSDPDEARRWPIESFSSEDRRGVAG